MSNLDDAIKELAKQGIEVAAIDAKRKDNRLEKFSTGLASLDFILGGGYPKGRLIEIYGMESSGKSTLCLLALAAVQRSGGIACLIDAEHAHDPAWSAKMGVDVSKLLMTQPDAGEQALTAVEKLAATGQVKLIVVDSMAALIPQKELEGDIGDMQVGAQARMMSQALRKLTAVAAKSGTTIIFINQVRNKIGVMYGDPTTTPGGMALKFYASLRFKVSKKEKIQESKDGPVLGNRVKVDVIKTKVSQPYQNAEFVLLTTGGIDQVLDTFNIALESGVIVKEGMSYLYGANKLAVGYDAAVDVLRSDPVLYESVYKDLQERIAQMQGPVIPPATPPAVPPVSDDRRKGKKKE